jgi:hypothetical protein
MDIPAILNQRSGSARGSVNSGSDVNVFSKHQQPRKKKSTTTTTTTNNIKGNISIPSQPH